jgi:hypothetical protein
MRLKTLYGTITEALRDKNCDPWLRFSRFLSFRNGPYETITQNEHIEEMFDLLVCLVRSGALVLIASKVRRFSTNRKSVTVARKRHYDCYTVFLQAQVLRCRLRCIHIRCTFLERNAYV